MTFTQADLANLKAALLTGALEVSVGDRTIRYRSQTEIIALIRLIEAQMAGSATQNPSKIQATYSKGK